MIYFDTETIGFHGPIILLQWAEDDGDVVLEDMWLKTVGEAMETLEFLTSQIVCGFNLAFDWFHVCQMHTTLALMEKHESLLSNYDKYADLEPLARSGKCLKPLGAFDVMLHARKGEYQTTMDRKDIMIKRVPVQLAHHLADKLDELVRLKDIYFSRKANKKERWKVYETRDEDFKNVVLKFAPSAKLKVLAADALGYEDAVLYGEIDLPARARPREYGFAPFAKAVERNLVSWPEVVTHYFSHWYYNSYAREYATNDVIYTRELYKYFGSPEPNDTDSVLSCMVGAVRWKGFNIDTNKMKRFLNRRNKYIDLIKKHVNVNSVKSCKALLEPLMSDTEKMIIEHSTKATILDEISKWTIAETCEKCNGFGCNFCNDGLVHSKKLHPAAKAAQRV
jgi:hypothetical protein